MGLNLFGYPITYGAGVKVAEEILFDYIKKEYL